MSGPLPLMYFFSIFYPFLKGHQQCPLFGKFPWILLRMWWTWTVGGAGENVLGAIYQTQELRDLFMFLARNGEKLIFPKKFLTLKPKVLFLTWIVSFCFVLGPSWFAIILIGYHPKYLYLLINVLWSWAPFKLNRILKETSPWGAQRLNLLRSLCSRPLHLHHRCIIYHHLFSSCESFNYRSNSHWRYWR